MNYEIDVLAVGDESKGGDAIALRYGDLTGPRSSQTVIVIDGGYTDSGERLVRHISDRFHTDRVDVVLSTHPDQDHVCGLEVVLEELSVGELWMHQPWRHSARLAEGRTAEFKSLGLAEKVQKSLEDASDLETIARRRGVPIIEPFTGVHTPEGAFRILGPTPEFYEATLAGIQPPSVVQKAASAVAELAEKITARLVKESLEHETLTDNGVTSPQNNTSAISILDLAGFPALLTGDAGIPALEIAVNTLRTEGWQVGNLSFVQIPHHGSRRNVGPTILNRLLGNKGQTSRPRVAYASVPAKNPEAKHPAKKATNAFYRRGCNVYLTQGKWLWHHAGSVPPRPDYGDAVPEPFHAEVEEFDEG